MRVYKRPDGASDSWYVEFRFKGRRYRRSLFVRGKENAWALAVKYREDVVLSRAGARATTEKRSDDLAETFREELRRRGRCARHVSQLVATVKKILPAAAPLRSIETRELVAKLAAIRGDRSRSYAHEALRSFFRWAIGQGDLERSPLEAVPCARALPLRRRRTYSRDDLRMLCMVVPFERAVCYMAAALTGLRRSELAQLRWADLDLAAGVLTVRAAVAKNRRFAVLPIGKELLDFLKRLDDKRRRRGHEGGGWKVFRTIPNARTVRRDLERARIPRETAAGVLDFHALRATFVTWLVAEKVHVFELQRLARHQRLDVTSGTYAKLLAEELRQAVDKLTVWPASGRPGEEFAA